MDQQLRGADAAGVQRSGAYVDPRGGQQHHLPVQQVIWLTATHRPHGFGPLESEYIAAGNWDAAMPVGMTVWA